MLVLSRKTEESVVVGGSGALGRVLKVTVLEIKSGHVRLGFEANEDVPIHRLEVWERMRANDRDHMGIGHSNRLAIQLSGSLARPPALWGGRWSEPSDDRRPLNEAFTSIVFHSDR